METEVQALTELSELLRLAAKKTIEKKVFVGFDGFVDKIKKAVKEKRNASTVYFDSIREFADRIIVSRSKSGQIQMDTQRIKLGGNAPILANTLGKLGVKTFCLGSMGYPDLHSVFTGMNPLCKTISVLNPGLSDAIEFDDGKLIFSELEVFDQYTWKHIKEVVDIGKISKSVSESAIIALVDWANLPHAADIWEGFLDDVIKPSERKDFLFLFDLCDPSKKTFQQIDEVLDVISSFSSYGKVILGLNENETLKICAALKGLDLISDKDKIPGVHKAGDFLYKSMNIDTLLVHPIDRTIVYNRHEIIELKGRLVVRPMVLTGGGDNLNAGFCLGLLYGFTLHQCMLLGMAASGTYIESGNSPDQPELIEYLNVWIHELRQIKTQPVQHIFTHRHQ